MIKEDIVREGGETPMRTDGATDMTHIADARLPAVQADGAVARLAGCRAHIPSGIEIGASLEKGGKEADLLLG
jgi:hypothetical protein